MYSWSLRQFVLFAAALACEGNLKKTAAVSFDLGNIEGKEGVTDNSLLTWPKANLSPA